MPALPASVATALLRAGVPSPIAFVQADPAGLAGRLTELLREELLGEKVTPEDVKAWQDGVRQLGMLALPTRRPKVDR